MSFQENLRFYREQAGYKQAKDFAKLLGIKYSTYTAYENQGREAKYSILCKIADLLNITTDELLGRENNILGNNEDEKVKKLIEDLSKSLKIKLIHYDSADDKNFNFYVGTNLTFGVTSIEKSIITKGINDISQQVGKLKEILLFNKLANIILDTTLKELDGDIKNNESIIKLIDEEQKKDIDNEQEYIKAREKIRKSNDTMTTVKILLLEWQNSFIKKIANEQSKILSENK